jgi:hypothetical protein
MTRTLLAAAAAAPLLAVGCGAPDPRSRSFEVSGVVTFAGEPVADGHMILMPEDATLPGDAGTITGGRFKFLASAGGKRVEIRATRPLPIPPGVVQDPVFVDYIPPRYNQESMLRIEVVPGAKNRFEFHLTAK